MTMKIQFLKDTSKAKFPQKVHSSDTLVLYREGYDLPKINNAVYMDFEKYRSVFTELNPKIIVMVGTNRIFVPSLRCDLVFEHLQTMTNHIEKYSVDTSPYIGEPWRLWFHYSLVYGQWLGYKYSYIVETDWQHWFYRDSDNSVISSENIKEDFKCFYSDLNIMVSSFDFYEPDLFLNDIYFKVKEFAFEKHNTPKLIIQTMLKELNKSLGIKFDFESYRENKNFKIPNFGVYKFVVEENIRRMKIYNTYGLEKKV